MKSTPAAQPGEARGLVINLGESLSKVERKRRLALLRKEVDAFRSLFKAAPEGQPLGSGAADVLVAFDPSRKVTVAEAWSAVHALRQHSLVADAEPAISLRLEPPLAPGSTKKVVKKSAKSPKHLPGSTPPTWSLNLARVTQARSKHGVGGKGVRVGHPDTGYTSHSEIVGSRLRTQEGYDFVDDKNDPRDAMTGSFPGHGTATSSVIFSGTVASPHVEGVAPQADLVPLRVSDSVIHFDFTRLVQALYRAREKGCHLVSMSLGGPWAGRSLERAVDALVADGMVLLAAAGNRWPFVVYPAKLPKVVAVAACNADEKPWKGSASGPTVDISAPGESVWRARTQRKSGVDKFSIERSSGTSYAVATTAGICALWLERHGHAALKQAYGGRLADVFRELLGEHCRKLTKWDTRNYGPGLVDASALLDAALPVAAPAKVTKKSAKAALSSATTRLQHYLPGMSEAHLARVAGLATGALRRASSVRKLGGPSKVVGISGASSLLDELEFHVATNTAVRRELLATAKVPARSKMTTKRSGLKRPRSTLGDVASPELVAAMRA